MRIEFELGDITRAHVDAIVNAANSSLLGGGGVDGAIHRAGGPSILAECRELRRTTWPDGLPTGRAAATTAGDMDATWVIHTVGPVYSAARADEAARALASCYRESLAVAARLGATSVAFPAVSTGVYRYPMVDAAAIAVSAVNAAGTAPEVARTVELVRFVLFSSEALMAFTNAHRAAT